MPETPNFGYLDKLYRNTGSHGTPTWVEISAVKDLNFTIEPSEIDDSDRGSPWMKFGNGQINAGITFQLNYRNGNPDHAVLVAAAIAGTVIEFAAMDQNIANSGAEGLRMFAKVLGYNGNQALADSTSFDVTLKPAYQEDPADTVVDPDWLII